MILHVEFMVIDLKIKYEKFKYNQDVLKYKS